MSDTSGQQTDRRHLLGNLQLLFQLHSVGDVLDDHQHPDHRIVTAGILQRHLGRVHEQARHGAVARGQRHPVQRGAVRMIVPRGSQRLDERRIEQIAKPAPDRRLAGDAIEFFERAIPPDDLLVAVEHHEAVVERFENVFVELAHAAELFGLEMQLPVEAPVFDCRGDLARNRRQEPEILAVEWLIRLFPAERQHGDRPPLEDARDEVVDPRVPPRLDFFRQKARCRDRIVERDRVAAIEPRHHG